MQPERPLYQQLADEFGVAIRNGSLPPGARLPTVRRLAAERGVDANTVSRAYQVLARQGLVEAHARRGTIVRALPPSVRSFANVLLPAAPGVLRLSGSHDFCLDVLARLLRPSGVRLVLSATGSAAGLRALAEGLVELAATHLLDEDGLDYNRDAVARLLPGRELLLLTLVEREQGLIVPRGNPHALSSIADLARPGLRLINRQPGSGTRLLLERLLRQAGIDPARLAGYERVVPTHLAAAAAVAGGSADLALGLHSAARALDLDFVPLLTERFELALFASARGAAWFGPLIETLASPGFRAEVEALGGYDGARSAWIRSA